MWFVVPVSFWCSQIAIVRDVIWSNRPPSTPSVISVLLAWAFFSWFYSRRRFELLFTFQCLIPALFGTIAILMALSGSEDSAVMFGVFFLVTLGENLICFPLAALLMAKRWALPSAGKRHDGRMPWWP
jgi:hypothetical protein